MPHPILTIGPMTTSTYAFLVGFGLLMAFFTVTMRYRLHVVVPIGHIVDALLLSMMFGLLLARALHVALNWAYFAGHQTEITQLSAGGLNWHGAMIGGWVGLILMGRARRMDISRLLDLLALMLPVVAFLAWWGCGAAHCAYGAEVERLVDYPAWLVWEERDIYNMIAPRFATQPLGMAASVVLLIIMTVIARRSWLNGRRFWVALVLLALTMFLIGFLRGDFAAMILGLRADQWLDLALVALGLFGLFGITMPLRLRNIRVIA